MQSAAGPRPRPSGGLDPARLQPRGGLAGLFDSRNKRLKTFRAAWTSAAASVTQSAADIGDRAGALAHKGTALETLWSETRDAIAELDAHIAAARSWLANEAPGPIAAEPVAEIAPEPIEHATHQRTGRTPIVLVEDAPEQHHEVVEAPVDANPAPGADLSRRPQCPRRATSPLATVIVEPLEPLETAESVAEPEADVVSESDPEPEVVPEPEASAEPAPEASIEPQLEPTPEALAELDAPP